MNREFVVAVVCIIAMFVADGYLKPGFIANTLVVLSMAGSLWALFSAIFSKERK